jgi:two-component system, chemotaxis family, response regulator Rcp1
VLRRMAEPIDILLVEDNPGDARLTLEVFKDCKIANRIVTARDGEEAIAYLRRNGPQADGFVPELILLDLNLPKKDGREVLAEIKGDLKLRAIPVVVLTTSSAEEDVLKTYGLQANCYITKPIDLEQFIRVVNQIQDFWMTIVRLPRIRSTGSADA